MRLNKLLSDWGVCSRRKADQLITEGRVTVNGETAVLGTQAELTDTIAVDGKPVSPAVGDKVYIALNKPRGIECTADPRVKDNVVQFVGHPARLYPVGRLDKESEGLIFLTNDGDFADFIMRAANFHEKEYEVRIDRPVTAEFLRRMASGVDLEGRMTRPATVTQVQKDRFRIVLTQGMNRQIRRMCEALDCRVLRLVRVRIMNVALGNLPKGQWRSLTPQEVAGIYRAGRGRGGE